MDLSCDDSLLGLFHFTGLAWDKKFALLHGLFKVHHSNIPYTYHTVTLEVGLQSSPTLHDKIIVWKSPIIICSYKIAQMFYRCK